MEKVFVVSKEFRYSEEDHYSEVVAVCSSEILASEFVKVVSSSLPSDSKTSYYFEEFNVIKHHSDRKAAIDDFLEKEFNIIPGCCSSQKSLEYHIAYLIADKLWK